MKNIYSGVKVAEIADLATNIVVNYGEVGLPQDAYLESVMTELAGLSERITGALKHHKTIASLERQASRRYDAVAAVSGVVRTGKRFSDSAIQDSYAAIRSVVDELLPAIFDGNYGSQTALIANMLQQLSSPTMVHHVDVLPGMREAVANLVTAQDEFIAKRNEYQRMLLGKPEDAATELKDRIRELVNGSLMVHLEDRRKVQPDDYDDFAMLVDSLIGTVNERVRRRRKAKKRESSSAALGTV